jgi:hypothetical protein
VQTQVKWLEGLLAAFILVIAAISGVCGLRLCLSGTLLPLTGPVAEQLLPGPPPTNAGMSCLYALDTPTRFQKPKEGSRAE